MQSPYATRLTLGSHWSTSRNQVEDLNSLLASLTLPQPAMPVRKLPELGNRCKICLATGNTVTICMKCMQS